MSEAALQCISDIHPDSGGQWMASRWWLWSPLCGCRPWAKLSGEDCHCHDPASDCIPGAAPAPPWPAVLCSAACSMLQSSGRPWSNPSPAPAPGQLPGLLPNSVTKCKGRAQGPASTSHPPRAGVAESDGFLLTQKEGESQKYKSQISLKRWNLIFKTNFVAHLHHIYLHSL